MNQLGRRDALAEIEDRFICVWSGGLFSLIVAGVVVLRLCADDVRKNQRGHDGKWRKGGRQKRASLKLRELTQNYGRKGRDGAGPYGAV